MLKNKIKAVESKQSDKVADIKEAVSWAQIFLFWYYSVRKQTGCRRLQSPVQSLWGFHCTARTHRHCQEHLHTDTPLLEEPLHSGLPPQATWSRTTEKGQTGAAELHIQVGISRAALIWANQEMAEVHVRHRAGMVLCGACYHCQKCLCAPLEPLRAHKEDIRQESPSWDLIPSISLSCNCKVKRRHSKSNVHYILCHQLPQ